MFGKVYASLWDGTLGSNWEAWSVFVYMLANCSPRGVIDVTPEALATRSHIPLEAVERGLRALEQPDRRSRSADNAGRRIVPLDPHRDWGWQIVNYDRYRKASVAERAEAWRKAHPETVASYNSLRRNAAQHGATRRNAAQRRVTPRNQAEAEADKPSPAATRTGVPVGVPPVFLEASPQDARAIIGGKRFEKPTLAEISAYCAERQALGRPAVDPEQFRDHYEANGWRVGRNPMKDWRGAVRTWERNDLNRPARAAKDGKMTAEQLGAFIRTLEGEHGHN